MQLTASMLGFFLSIRTDPFYVAKSINIVFFRCSESLLNTGLFNSIDTSLDACGDSILGLVVLVVDEASSSVSR